MTMMSSSEAALVAVVTLVLAVALVKSLLVRKKPKFREVPGKLPLIGHAHLVGSTRKIVDTFDAWAANYGTAEFWLLGNRYVLVAEDDSVKALAKQRPRRVQRHHNIRDSVDSFFVGIFSAELPHWTVERRLISPAFSHANIAKFLPTLRDLGRRLVDFVASEGVLCGDANALAQKFTADVIGLLSFGQDLGNLRGRVNEKGALFEQVLTIVGERAMGARRLWKIPFVGPWLDGSALLTRRVHAAMAPIIQDAKTSNKGGTVLEKMIATNDEDKLDDARLLGNVIQLYVAGSETTAIVIAWMLYHLARLPDFQTEARREAKAVVESTPCETIPDALASMPLLRSLWQECLRLHNPASFVMLENNAPVEVAGQTVEPFEYGLLVPARYLAKRFGGPEFDPRRWLHDRLPAEAIPFGFGVRVCPGKDLAELEACTAVAHLLHAFDVTSSGDQEVSDVFLFTQKPDRPITLRFTPVV